MDTLKFLQEGNIRQNPEYNPKTKKGANQPPYVVDYNIGTDAQSKGLNAVVGSVLMNNFDATHLNKDAYNKHDVYLGKNYDEEELNKELANNQGALERLANMTAQIGESEILIGSLKAFSDLYDAAINIAKDTNDYTNPVSKFLEEQQESIKERLAIYRENPDKAFDFSDFGWLTDNLVSIGSSVALLLPAAGVSKIGSIVGKATKLDRGLNNVVTNIAKKAGKLKGLNKPAFRANVVTENIKDAGKAATMALVSRTAENYQEARQTYQSVYDNTLAQLSAMNNEQKQDFIERNPSLEEKSNEEIAEQLASISGNKTFKDDYAMLLMDVLEYRALGKLWKGQFKNTPSFKALREAEEQTAKLAGEEAVNAISKSKLIRNLRLGIKNPGIIAKGVLGGIPFNEGIEEGFQGYTQARSEELANLLLDKNITPRALSSYLTDPTIWEQAFFGIAAGGIFQAGANGARNIKNRIKDIKEQKKLSVDGIKQYIAEQKASKTEISNWTNELDSLAKDLGEINEGYIPLSYGEESAYETDALGNPIVGEDGARVRRKYDEADINSAKINRINGFLTNLGIKATNGNYFELLRDFITDKNFNKYLREQGVEETDLDKYLSQNFLDTLDNVHDTYLDSLDRLYNNVDSPSGYGIKSAASNLTRTLLNIQSYNNEIDNVNQQLSNQDDYSQVTDDYLYNEQLKQLKVTLEGIAEEKSKYYKQYGEGKISKSALDAYNKELDRLRYSVLTKFQSIKNESDFNKQLNEKLNELVKNVKKSKNIDEGIKENYTEFENLLNSTLFNIDSEIVDNSQVPIGIITKNLINRKIELESERDIIENSLPQTKEDYQDYYEEINQGMDLFFESRARNAINTIKDYLKKSKNIEQAFDDLLTNNLKEVEGVNLNKVQEALDILKLGHERTAHYQNAIRGMIAEIGKERAEQERKENTIVDNGKVKTKQQSTNATTQQTKSQTQSNPPTGNQTEANAEIIIENQGIEEQIQQDIDAIIEASPVEENIESIDDYVPTDDEIEENNRKITKIKLSDWFVTNWAKYGETILNIKSFDTSDANYTTLRNIIYDECKLNGLSETETQKVIEDSLKSLVSFLQRGLRFDSTPKDKKDKLKFIINAIHNKLNVTKKEDGNYSVTRVVTDDEIVNEITELLNVYKELKHIDDNVIDVEDLFDYLFNSDISFEEARTLFSNIQDLIDKNKTFGDIKFVNTKEFTKYKRNIVDFYNKLQNTKTESITVNKNMHIQQPRKIENRQAYEAAVDRTKRGEGDITIIDTGNSLSIRNNNIEIGYLSKIDVDSNNGSVSAKKTGFRYNLRENNGKIESNFDKLFLDLIHYENANDKIKKLFELANKYRKKYVGNGKYAYNAGNGINIKEEDIQGVLDAIDEETMANIKFAETTNNDKLKAEAILKNICDVLFFGQKQGFDVDIAEAYYNNWNERLYQNYIETSKIQDLIAQGKQIEVNVTSTGYEELNYTDDYVNIKDNKFIKDDAKGNPVNYVVAVKDNTGTLISEVDIPLTQISDAKLPRGTMGIVVHNHLGTPFIAKFTESNNIIGTEIGNKIKSEITRLLEGFYKGTITYTNVRDAFINLFGSKSGSSPLTFGVRIIEQSGRFYVRDSNTGKFIASFFQNANNGKSAATLWSNGNIVKNTDPRTGKEIPYFVYNPQYINNIINNILSSCKFNRSIFTLVNKEKDNKDNPYFYKENGKLYVMGNEYDSYFDYIIQNNCFKTNVKNINGSFTHRVDTSDSLFINTNFIEKAKYKIKARNLYGEKANLEKAINLISSANLKNPVSTRTILDAMDISEDYKNLLLDELGAFDKDIYYNSRVTSEYDAKYDQNNGHVIISKKGIGAIQKNDFDLLRLIAHENLHHRFEELGIADKTRITNELLDTYQQWYNAVINYTGNDKDLIWSREFIKLNKFTPEEFRKGISKEKFAEEWLMESITRPELTNALQKIDYNGEIKTNTNKSLFQRILEAILNLLNKTLDLSKKNTILAKQISIFNDNTVSENTNVANEIIVENNESTVVSPVEEEQSNEQTNSTEIPEEIDITEDIDNFDLNSAEDDFGDISLDDLSTTVNPEIIEQANTDINTFEALLEQYYNGGDITNGMFITMLNREQFLQLFPSEKRLVIASLLDSGRLKFVCR